LSSWSILDQFVGIGDVVINGSEFHTVIDMKKDYKRKEWD